MLTWDVRTGRRNVESLISLMCLSLDWGKLDYLGKINTQNMQTSPRIAASQDSIPGTSC